MATTIVEISSSQSVKFDWRIENFSKLSAWRGICSDVFSVGGFKWKAQIYPKGRVGVYDHISLFLCPVDLTKLVDAEFSFEVTSQTDPNKNDKAGTRKRFPEEVTFLGRWGCPMFMSLGDLQDPDNGYIVNDTCIIKVEVTCNMDAEMDESNPINIAKTNKEKRTKEMDGKSSSLTEEYPGAGQPFGGGIHYENFGFPEDKEFEDVGGFSVSKTQATLYRKMWLQYGHIPSTKVMPIASYPILVMVVKDLMSCITDMHQCHYVDLSSEKIGRWEDMIKLAEKLEFNIGWLRERFEVVKKGMGGMQNARTDLFEPGQPLRVAQEKMKILRDAMKKVEVQLIEAKANVRDSACGLLSETDIEMYLEIGETLLLDGLF